MSGSEYSAYCKPYFKQFIVINTTDSYLLISTCMENIQDTPFKQARRKLCHPEGVGGGGSVGGEKEKKKG